MRGSLYRPTWIEPGRTPAPVKARPAGRGVCGRRCVKGSTRPPGAASGAAPPGGSPPCGGRATAPNTKAGEPSPSAWSLAIWLGPTGPVCTALWMVESIHHNWPQCKHETRSSLRTCALQHTAAQRFSGAVPSAAVGRKLSLPVIHLQRIRSAERPRKTKSPPPSSFLGSGLASPAISAAAYPAGSSRRRRWGGGAWRPEPLFLQRRHAATLPRGGRLGQEWTAKRLCASIQPRLCACARGREGDPCRTRTGRSGNTTCAGSSCSMNCRANCAPGGRGSFGS